MMSSGEDSEMLEMIREEVATESNKLDDVEELLVKSLLPKDIDDERGVVIEVRAGTGTKIIPIYINLFYAQHMAIRLPRLLVQ
jgi:peptide chain release factor 1